MKESIGGSKIVNLVVLACLFNFTASPLAFGHEAPLAAAPAGQGQQNKISLDIKGMDVIDVFPEGAIVIRGKDEPELKARVDSVKRAIVRAMGCVGCGVCLGRCPKGAIVLVDGKATINVDDCGSCGLCSEKCPVTDFVDERTDEEVF